MFGKRTASASLAVVDSPPSARERHRQAIEARAATRREIAEAEAVLERLERLITEGQAAADRYEQARVNAETAELEWSRAGCDPQTAVEHQRLRADAEEAKRQADAAQAAAAGASKGLPQARYAMQSGRLNLRKREDDVHAAIGLRLIEEAASLLERRERLAREYSAVDMEYCGLKRVLDPQFCEDSSHASDEAARALYAVAERGVIKKPGEYIASNTGSILSTPPAEILEAREFWRRRAQALMLDE